MSSNSQSPPAETSHSTGDAGSVHDDKSSITVRTHSLPTTHGTHLRGPNFGMEVLEYYEQGGYHPVHIGDTLGTSNRYRVIDKLGYGGSGTVWLCRDLQDSRYVSVKVMTADASTEPSPDLLLTKLDRSLSGAEYIVNPLDLFSIVGPNGTHQCLVLPVLGPRVSHELWRIIGKDPRPVFRGMAYQAALAMNFLHKQGFCHGDFRPGNILVKLANFDHLTEAELLSRLGQPYRVYVDSVSGEDIPAFQPQYLTEPADIVRLGSEYLTDQISVIDFSESYPITSPPPDLGIPQHYQPPELLLELENSVSIACDLWALGCTLFEIRQQIPLFYMINDKDELVAEIFRFFGKPPQTLWDKWEARQDYFDKEGTWLGNDEFSLELAMSNRSEDVATLKENMITSEAEKALIVDLLKKLCRYQPEDRASAADVLTHEWFKFKRDVI